MEDWIFGHQTQEALMTLQAMKGLPETGVCDLQTWEMLLGPGFRPVAKEEIPVGSIFNDEDSAADQVSRCCCCFSFADSFLPTHADLETPRSAFPRRSILPEAQIL